MSALLSAVRNHPVFTFLVITFGISWGGLIPIAGFNGFPGEASKTETLFPVAVTLLLAGPFIAGVLLVGVIDGVVGYRAVLGRLIKWRLNIRYYLVALLAAPIMALVLLSALTSISTDFVPAIFATEDKAALVLTGVCVGVFGGFLEEIGWTGFAVPKLLKRMSVVGCGLLIGVTWGVWHFLVTYWASGDASGDLQMSLLLAPLLFYAAVLPPFRVVMVWVYARSESLLVTILMHTSLTASTLFILIPEEDALIPYYLVFGGVLWTVIAAFAILNTKGRN